MPQTIVLTYFAGATATATLRSEPTGAAIAGGTGLPLTPVPGRPGTYTVAAPDAATGLIEIDIDDGGFAAWYFARLPGTDGATVRAYEVVDLVDAAPSRIASSVWAATTRTLTTFGTLVADVAAAVRSALGIELARIDVATSTRLASGAVTVGGYSAGQSPASQVLVEPANRLLTSTAGHVTATNGGGGGTADPDAIAEAVADRLAGQTVTVQSWVTTTGEWVAWIGDVHRAADGRGLYITDTTSAWPTLTGRRAWVVGEREDDLWHVEATITSATRLDWELTAAVTSERQEGAYRTAIVVTDVDGSSNPVTLSVGTTVFRRRPALEEE
jgi:hypothetical protein